MQIDSPDHALRAANLAIEGRRVNGTASRFASIQLRDIDTPSSSDRSHLAWEVAAVFAVSVASVLGVLALWFL